MTKLDAFEQMGGRQSLVDICKLFYDKVYADTWLKLYFEHIPQDHIERQQVDFMQRVLGGDNIYAGKTPPNAPPHMFISNELFDLRQKILADTFKELGSDERLREKWLTIDETFRKSIVKDSPDQCHKRFKTDDILNFPKP